MVLLYIGIRSFSQQFDHSVIWVFGYLVISFSKHDHSAKIVLQLF